MRTGFSTTSTTGVRRTPRVLTILLVVHLLITGIVTTFAAGQVEEAETGTPTETSDGDGTDADRGAGLVPERIVSMAPAVTEMLYAVGAADQVIGVTEYCNYPPEATEKEKIGGFSIKSISLEAIVALEPDLVLGVTSMHAELQAPLEAAGQRVVMLRNSTYSEVFSSLYTVGELTGHAGTASELISDLESRTQAVVSKVETIPEDERKTVFWEIWDNPLMAAGSSSFIGQSIEMAGARNVVADAQGDWPQVSLEEVIERNPDVVISSNSHGGKQGIGDIAQRPGWNQLEAVREGRLYLLPDDLLSRPGPRVVDGLEMVARLVYPELFSE